MFRKLALAAIPASLLAMPVLAQGFDITGLDSDGDGLVSEAELYTYWTDADLPPDAFARIDTDADGFLTPEELQAAITAGIITPDNDMEGSVGTSSGG